MRALCLVLPFFCAAATACSGHDATAADAGAAEAERIPCAHRGEGLAPRCSVEREQGPNGTVLVLRHPDGGFRRLLIAGDGRGVVVADGAVPARVTIAGPDLIEVAVGGDRYRLPATVGR